MPDLDRSTTWLPLLAVVGLALLSATYVLFSADGALRWLELRRESALLAAENEVLKRENEALRQNLRKLTTDRVTQERTAREVLGYTRKDELVFKFGDAGTAAARVRP